VSPIDFRSNGCLEVKPQAHLDVPGRVELTAHHPEVLWRRYVCTRFEREILAPAEHGVVEGIDKLHVETRGKPFRDARCLGQREVHVPPEQAANSTEAQPLIVKGGIAELTCYCVRVSERIRDASR